MKLKIKKSEYQDIADCILMEQVSAPEIAELSWRLGMMSPWAPA